MKTRRGNAARSRHENAAAAEYLSLPDLDVLRDRGVAGEKVDSLAEAIACHYWKTNLDPAKWHVGDGEICNWAFIPKQYLEHLGQGSTRFRNLKSKGGKQGKHFADGYLSLYEMLCKYGIFKGKLEFKNGEEVKRDSRPDIRAGPNLFVVLPNLKDYKGPELGGTKLPASLSDIASNIDRNPQEDSMSEDELSQNNEAAQDNSSAGNNYNVDLTMSEYKLSQDRSADNAQATNVARLAFGASLSNDDDESTENPEESSIRMTVNYNDFKISHFQCGYREEVNKVRREVTETVWHFTGNSLNYIHFEKSLDDSNNYVVVGKYKGEICSLYIFSLSGRTKENATIALIWTKQCWQGRGFCSRLMQAGLKFMHDETWITSGTCAAPSGKAFFQNQKWRRTNNEFTVQSKQLRETLKQKLMQSSSMSPKKPRSSPDPLGCRRSNRPKKERAFMLEQVEVEKGVLEMRMADGCGLEQPDSQKMTTEERQEVQKRKKGTELFYNYLRPKGWSWTARGDGYVFRAPGVTKAKEMEGINTFHSYQAIWDHYKEDGKNAELFMERARQSMFTSGADAVIMASPKRSSGLFDNLTKRPEETGQRRKKRTAEQLVDLCVDSDSDTEGKTKFPQHQKVAAHKSDMSPPAGESLRATAVAIFNRSMEEDDEGLENSDILPKTSGEAKSDHNSPKRPQEEGSPQSAKKARIEANNKSNDICHRWSPNEQKIQERRKKLTIILGQRQAEGDGNDRTSKMIKAQIAKLDENLMDLILQEG